MIARKCIVKGKVQGVFFRATALARAEELGISGSASNLPNGDVEVIACGGVNELELFVEWLKQGPRLAEVTSVTCEPFEGEVPEKFSIG